MTQTTFQEQRGMSFDEIESKLRENGYVIEGEHNKIEDESLNMSAYLYHGREEAINHNISSNENISPSFNGPFVAIFYCDEVLYLTDLDSFTSGGKLYEDCRKNNLPVQEFFSRNLDEEEIKEIGTASRTLSRLEKKLKGETQ